MPCGKLCSATRTGFKSIAQKAKKLQIFFTATHTKRGFDLPKVINERCPLDFRCDMWRDDHRTPLF